MKKIIVYTLLIVSFACNDNKNIKDETSNNTIKDTAAIIKKYKTIEDTVQQKTIVKDTTVTSVKVNKDSTLLSLRKEILTAIKNNDYEKFAGFIHPVEGIRFSQYGYVDIETDVKFKAVDFLKKLNERSAKINWGPYDAREDFILLTMQEYFKQYVYSHDFLNAKNISIDKNFNGTNSGDSINETYKNCFFVINNFPNTVEAGAMDWRSLILVFKNYNNQFYLVGIIDDQWTI